MTTDQFKEFIKKNPHLKDYYWLLAEMRKESPRGAVLISCSFVEDQLQKILKSFLVETSIKMFEEENSVLGTLYAKAAIALSLGLINQDEYDEIKIFRKIRNQFAHITKINFDDPEIVRLCKKLKLFIMPNDIVLPWFEYYLMTVTVLINGLMNRVAHVSEKRLKIIDWGIEYTSLKKS
ncbi:MAG: hypothetical protein K1X44_07190 [Alphaproteobacteria bacterium]|nr:hypothetical protein [Alphaproteobacteria bacterium]